MHVGDPGLVVQIPLHGLADARLEGFHRRPAQLLLDLACIDGITPVVPRAVGDKGNLQVVGFAISARLQLVQQGTHGVHDVQIGHLVPAAHVVRLTRLAGFQHPANGAAMVFHIQPVAYLLAVAIDRQGFAGQRVHDHQRNEFFRKVQRAIVVGAVGGEHRQAIGMVVGAHQVVTGRLGGRIGAVGLVAVLLGEGRLALGKRPIHLVGGHMQQAKPRLVCTGQAAPIGTQRLQQVECAHDIGLDELCRAVDRAIHMRLSREVDDGAGSVLVQKAGKQRSIPKIAVHKHVACITVQTGEVLQVAGVGEFVQVDDRLVAGGQPVDHKIAADEAGAAGDKYGHVRGSRSANALPTRSLADNTGVLPFSGQSMARVGSFHAMQRSCCGA